MTLSSNEPYMLSVVTLNVREVFLRQCGPMLCSCQGGGVYFERCDRNRCLWGYTDGTLTIRFQRMYAAPLLMVEYF